MSRILLITNRLVVGGPSFHLLQLVKHFNSQHTILLVYGKSLDSEISLEKSFQDLGIQLVQIRALQRNYNLFSDLFFVAKLMIIFHRFKPDIVHTHTYKPGLYGRLVARLFKVKKVVHTYHGLIYRNYFNSLFSQLIVFLDRLSARKTDVIISLSESQKRELVDLYHISTEKLIKVIPLSIAQKAADFTEAKAKAFKQRWKIPDEVIVVSQVGRITKVKNNQLLLDFFAKIRKEFTAPILLVIAGDGELKASLIDRAMALGLNVGETADAFVEVLFTSWCTHLDQLYSATDIVVLTSLSEGTPLSIIEAQMAGVAVLSAKVGGVQDLIEEGFSGLLFSNQEEFEYKFKQLLNSEALRVSIGTNAAKFAASKFSEAKMLQQYDQIYKII